MPTDERSREVRGAWWRSRCRQARLDQAVGPVPPLVTQPESGLRHCSTTLDGSPPPSPMASAPEVALSIRVLPCLANHLLRRTAHRVHCRGVARRGADARQESDSRRSAAGAVCAARGPARDAGWRGRGSGGTCRPGFRAQSAVRFPPRDALVRRGFPRSLRRCRRRMECAGGPADRFATLVVPRLRRHAVRRERRCPLVLSVVRDQSRPAALNLLSCRFEP